MGIHNGKRKARVSLAFFISISLLCGFRCSLPWSAGQDGTISIVSYNAHNVFDSTDDGGEYPEFTSAGGWNDRLYRLRLENLAKSVLSLFPSGKDFPDVLCLQEIESVQVLKDLAQGVLKQAGYRWLGLGGPEDSPIKSGFLSRLPIIEQKAHGLDDSWGLGAGREILEVVFDASRLGASAPALITIFICHWKSRKEGVEATEPMRRGASSLVAGRIAEIASLDATRPIICLGDFNESPDEFRRNSAKFPVALMPAPHSQEFEDLVAGIPDSWFSGTIRVTGIGKQSRITEGNVELFSPWFASSGYSYRFQGNSERLDGFLLSPALFDGFGLEYQSFQVADYPELFDENGNPFGWNGATGYSDHLPILLDLLTVSDSALKNPALDVK